VAASGARVVIDSTGTSAYDSSATDYGAGPGRTVQIKNDGSAFFHGPVLSQAAIYGPVIATSAVVGTTGNAGFQLSGQFLDFFTIGTSPEGGRYYYAPDGSTPFSLAGVLAAGSTTFARASEGVTERITPAGGAGAVRNAVLAVASFKPATTIALVKLGTLATGSTTSVSPTFGQATAAGNLLTAWVSCHDTAVTAAGGWVKAETASDASPIPTEVSLWYKLNCGAAETAPTFTATTGWTMFAQLAEWSGAAIASALDQIGATAATGSAKTIYAGTSGVDATAGDLVLTASAWLLTNVTSGQTFADNMNNGTLIRAGDTGSTSDTRYSVFNYSIQGSVPTGKVLQLTNFVGLEAITSDNSLGHGFTQTHYSDDGNSSLFGGRKARGDVSSPTAILNGDTITALYAQAYDGSNWQGVGLAGFVSNGTVSAGSVPSDFVVGTGSATSNIAVAFTVKSNAHVLSTGGTAPTLGALQANVSAQSISGTDVNMRITTTAGASGVAAGAAIAVVSYGTAYVGTPQVTGACQNATSYATFTAVANSGFTLRTGAALALNAQFFWACHTLSGS
jgi:hypothetical protein